MARASAMWIEPSTPGQMGLDLRMTEMGLDLRIGNLRQIEGGHTDHRGHDHQRHQRSPRNQSIRSALKNSLNVR